MIPTVDTASETSAGRKPANHAERITAAIGAEYGRAVATGQNAVVAMAAAVNSSARP